MLSNIKYKIKKLLAGLTLLSLQVIALLLVFICALVIFIYIAKMVFSEKNSGFDLYAFQFFSRYVSDVNTNVMEFFTFLGTHTFLIPANLILIAYFLFIKKHRWYSIKVPVVAISSLLLMFSLKYIFHRNRPLTPLLRQAEGFSFPSGHALNSFTFYGLLIFLVWQNVKNKWLKWTLMLMLMLLIIVIGLSRVYLRVHYISDVIAGFSVGLMWLVFSLWVLRLMEKFSSKKVDPIVQQTNKTAINET